MLVGFSLGHCGAFIESFGGEAFHPLAVVAVRDLRETVIGGSNWRLRRDNERQQWCSCCQRDLCAWGTLH